MHVYVIQMIKLDLMAIHQKYSQGKIIIRQILLCVIYHHNVCWNEWDYLGPDINWD